MKTARSVPVLMYHHVSPSPGLVTVSPENFAAQMRGLAAAGYRTLGADGFAAFLAGAPVPDKSVLLTFDDGWLDNWVYAQPVLERHGFSAVMFIVSAWVGDGPCRPQAGEPGAARPATPGHNACKASIAEGNADAVVVRWSEIAAMRAAGSFEFHSHTHTHVRWDQATADAGEKRRRLAEDLAAARATLADRLGAAGDHLCWPQGYFDDDYMAVATAAGFRHLYTVLPGANRPGDPPARIHRIVVKDKGAGWLLSRLWLYRQPRLADWYAARRQS
ncbi:MAG TPA: polysaccharide deacetylase family protein [Rhodocyclaceae bacterium]|nr:polysaccharide deacetylase family protein [Rhodocyclaceae bacterium]